MEEGQHPALHGLIEVVEQIAAAHHVEPRERRVARHVVRGEDAHFADRLGDLVAAIGLEEEAPQPLRRDLRSDAFRVTPGARPLDRLRAHVGAEDLDRRSGLLRSPRNSSRADRDRVDFLAAGAAGHPDADRILSASALPSASETPDARALRGTAGVAEEAGDHDQQILRQRLQLGQVVLQKVHVAEARSSRWCSAMRRARRRSTVARL